MLDLSTNKWSDLTGYAMGPRPPGTWLFNFASANNKLFIAALDNGQWGERAWCEVEILCEGGKTFILMKFDVFHTPALSVVNVALAVPSWGQNTFVYCILVPKSTFNTLEVP